MNYQRVLEFVSGSFEIFPSKLKEFENSLKLPGVVFSISLIIYTRNWFVFTSKFYKLFNFYWFSIPKNHNLSNYSPIKIQLNLIQPLIINRKNSPGWARTNNLPVNSRLLHHWATEEYYQFIQLFFFTLNGLASCSSSL